MTAARLPLERIQLDALAVLMGADRINVVEGIVQDLGRGKVPNIPAEMGVRSEWQHNKKGLATKVGVTLAVSTALVLLVRHRKARSAPVSIAQTDL
jgi:hypothetical protein